MKRKRLVIDILSRDWRPKARPGFKDQPVTPEIKPKYSKGDLVRIITVFDRKFGSTTDLVRSYYDQIVVITKTKSITGPNQMSYEIDNRFWMYEDELELVFASSF